MPALVELIADHAFRPVRQLPADQGHLHVELHRDRVARGVADRFQLRGGVDLDGRALRRDVLHAGARAVGVALPVVGGGHGVRGLEHPLGEPGQVDVDDPSDHDVEAVLGRVGLEHLDVAVAHAGELVEV
jgi:hypothetical protein